MAKATFEERVEELHRPKTGIYPRHGAYIRRCLAEWGTIDCRDLCFPFDETTPEGKKERARNCKKIIGWCAAEAVKAALSKSLIEGDLVKENADVKEFKWIANNELNGVSDTVVGKVTRLITMQFILLLKMKLMIGMLSIYL